jgi:hypothetical protein
MNKQELTKITNRISAAYYPLKLDEIENWHSVLERVEYATADEAITEYQRSDNGAKTIKPGMLMLFIRNLEARNRAEAERLSRIEASRKAQAETEANRARRVARYEAMITCGCINPKTGQPRAAIICDNRQHSEMGLADLENRNKALEATF